jgi:hypothetical protein
MKLLQRGAYRKTNTLGSMTLSLAVLIMLPCGVVCGTRFNLFGNRTTGLSLRSSWHSSSSVFLRFERGENALEVHTVWGRTEPTVSALLQCSFEGRFPRTASGFRWSPRINQTRGRSTFREMGAMPRDRAFGLVQAVARCPGAQIVPRRRRRYRAPFESNLADAWLEESGACCSSSSLWRINR